MTDVIRVENVWKKFKIPHEKKTTVLDKVATLFQLLGGKSFLYEELWALKGITFSVLEGESLGVIGENGSGKSTLLKIIANILRPDRGNVEVRGKIAPILELGVGFHPELTVEENSQVYGSILGLKNKEVRMRLNSILEFAGLERFKDVKLKNLSSGMQIRLGFSVAIETDPDIFLIDEALAVGDMEFQNKCIKKFRDFKNAKKTIVLVSHSMNLIEKFCEKTLFLSNGKEINYGVTDRIVKNYRDSVLSNQ